MQNKTARFFLLMIVALYVPVSSMAWGMLGHRIVGGIADKYITAKTRLQVKKILGNESIAMSSNWADFIKSDSTFKYLDPWHYINFEKGLTYVQVKEVLKNDTAVDAYTKINFLVKELKKKTLGKDKKTMYLRLLIHIVGDIHQPLHVSPVGSTGGNDIKVNWFSTTSNLHRVWDSHLVEQQQLSFTEYIDAINFSSLQERKNLQKDPLSKWLFESYVIAQQLHDEITTTNPRLGYEYNFRHLETVNIRLEKGGIRLAGLLNEIYGQ